MALGLDDLGRIGGQTARRSNGHDLALLYSYVALSHIFWGDHQATSDDYIEHRAPPCRMVYCLYLERAGRMYYGASLRAAAHTRTRRIQAKRGSSSPLCTHCVR